jgi:anion-transporting  ArsA/GET3 family ATPase
VVIVAGKGGVGKTTVTAALARTAALAGLTTLVVEVEGKSGLATLYGQPPFAYDEVVLSPGGPGGAADVLARTLTPDEALLEYLSDHGLNRISRRLVSSGALDVVATAVPGIRDILVLGKVKSLSRETRLDLVLLDAPAAGHAITFLGSARGLVDAVKVGPIHTQARDVMDLLGDPRLCRVLLVTLPEETPVNELVETAFNLEDQVGVSLGPVIVNGVYPELAGMAADPTEAALEVGATLRPGESAHLGDAAAFRRERTDLQVEQVRRLADQLPLPQISLPFLFSADLGTADLAVLSDAMRTGIEALPASEPRPAPAEEVPG